MSHQNSYLESKVLSASPHKLHLMLIEGAIRFGRNAQKLMEQGDNEAAGDSLLRMLDIVVEMLAGVRGKKSEINLKLANLYLFIFRRLAEAKLENDIAMLNEALGVLEYERETWQLACKQMEEESAEPHSAPRGHVPLAPHLPHGQSSRLSLEA